MSTILAVNRQWSSRPADQNYDNLRSAYDAAREHWRNSIERAEVDPSTLRAEPQDGEVVLVGKKGIPAQLTHWAFGQLSNLVGAPSSYLRKLPATLAAQNLNYGLKGKYGESGTAIEKVNMLLQHNGSNLVRSINSDIYARIWDYELLAKCMELTPLGWTNPRPFNQGDQVGTVWVSDHDMFVFQVNERNLVKVPGEDRYLRRGYIMSNSEVGGGKWRTMTFLFDYMCCNRMIWGSTQVNEIAVRHVGQLADRVDSIMHRFQIDATRYAESSGNVEEGKIQRAMSAIIADTKEQVIEKVFKLLRGELSQKAIGAGYDTAVNTPDTLAPAKSVWGLANGITRYSQTIPYTDDRMVMDKAAGKLVELADAF